MLIKKCFIQFILFLILFQVAGASQRVRLVDTTIIQYGVASYYADKFAGRKTASGEIFSQQKMTAAHNSLPLGTYIEVTNLRNNLKVYVKINDRLHPRNKRLVDLSKMAAIKLRFINAGLTRVKIRVVEREEMQ